MPDTMPNPRLHGESHLQHYYASLTDDQVRDAYEGGASIESLGGLVASRRLWRIYGGDAAYAADDHATALDDIAEWIVCNS